MRKILFICSGNTCRSPLALAAWRALENAGQTPHDIKADSAGLMATADTKVSQYALDLAREWDQSLAEHRAKMLEPSVVNDAHWVVVMNSSHEFALREYFRESAQKIVLLGTFDPQNGDDEILDPFGGSRESYGTCAARIHRATKSLATAIQNGEL